VNENLYVKHLHISNTENQKLSETNRKSYICLCRSYVSDALGVTCLLRKKLLATSERSI